jgi:hypothetical protein
MTKKEKDRATSEHDRSRALITEGLGEFGVSSGPALGMVRCRVTHGTTINVPEDSEDPDNLTSKPHTGDDEIVLDARTAQSLALVGQVEIIGGAE